MAEQMNPVTAHELMVKRNKLYGTEFSVDCYLTEECMYMTISHPKKDDMNRDIIYFNDDNSYEVREIRSNTTLIWGYNNFYDALAACIADDRPKGYKILK